MGELAQRIAEGPCLRNQQLMLRCGTPGGCGRCRSVYDDCVNGSAKHPECAEAAVAAWLQEQRERVERAMYAANVRGSNHGAKVAIDALVDKAREE